MYLINLDFGRTTRLIAGLYALILFGYRLHRGILHKRWYKKWGQVRCRKQWPSFSRGFSFAFN